jgi:two-component system invasion response regulator UvrY
LSKAIRVVLVDDHEMVLVGIEQLLNSNGVDVVGTAMTLEDALTEVGTKKPDVLVFDYSMPEGDGMQITQQALKQYPDLRLLVLTMHENVHYLSKIYKAGAHGYITKSSSPKNLLTGIEQVAAGERYTCPEMASKVSAFDKRALDRSVDVDSLSTREFELMRMLGQGKTIQECAALMKVSESTCSTYRSRILKKLNLESTGSIIRFAVENDFVS